MSTATSHPRIPANVTRSYGVGVMVTGALASVIGSLMMAMYAMITSETYQHHGFFTPLYHIASTFISTNALMASMQHAMMGGTFYFTLGPAILGAVIHMMTGAFYGAILALLVSMRPLAAPIVVMAATAWGAVAFVLSTWVFLPLVASVLSSGDQITHMASLVGYGTFLGEHLIFGMTAGVLLALSQTRRRRGRKRATCRQVARVRRPRVARRTRAAGRARRPRAARGHRGPA